MSTITKPNQTHKKTIVEAFYTYCIERFGMSSWKKFMEDEEFNRMVKIYEEKHSNYVFSTLVDIVSEMETVPIKQILAELKDYY